MRVVGVLQHLQLLLHEIHKDLMLPYVSFIHDLHGQGDISGLVENLAYLSKGSFSKLFATDEVSPNIIRASQALEHLELQDLFLLA